MLHHTGEDIGRSSARGGWLRVTDHSACKWCKYELGSGPGWLHLDMHCSMADIASMHGSPQGDHRHRDSTQLWG